MKIIDQYKNMTNVAAVIPIGPLDSMGYQYHWKLSVRVFSSVFDKVLLVTTTSLNKNLYFERDNVELLCYDEALFDLDENGCEVFDIWKIYKALQIGARKAKDEGFDFAFVGSINMVVSLAERSTLYSYLEGLKQSKSRIGWSRRSFVLGRLRFAENAIIPNIYNLEFLDRVNWDIDSMVVGNFRFRIMKYCGFSLPNLPIIYDVLGTETETDFREKFSWYEKSYRAQLNRPGKDKKYSDFLDKLTNSVLINCVESTKSPTREECWATELFSASSAARIIERRRLFHSKVEPSYLHIAFRRTYLRVFMWLSSLQL